MKNPFIHITPRQKEEIVGAKNVLRDLNKGLNDVISRNRILMLTGKPGSGRSLMTREFIRLIKKRKGLHIKEFSLSNRLAHELKMCSTKKCKDVYIITEFEYYAGMDKNLLKRLINTIANLSKKGVKFFLSTTSESVADLLSLDDEFKRKARIITIPPLTLPEAKKLIILRLNEVRKKSNSLSPFSEKEVTYIWKKSRGNPRMILMICASLFDAKMLIEEVAAA